MIPTEVLIAFIAAGGIVGAGIVGSFTAWMTARHQARVRAASANEEFLAERDKLLWEQADKFWNARAGEMAGQITLERIAREAETASLKADIALLKQDSVRLNLAHADCENTVKALEARLIRAGEQLTAAVKAEIEAQADE